MLRFLCCLVLCVGVTYAVRAQCDPSKLKDVKGKSVCPPQKWADKLTGNKLACNDQAALVCNCVEDEFHPATCNPCDECNWVPGTPVGTDTKPGDWLATFDDFIICPGGSPAATSGKKKYGGSVFIFQRWDNFTPYCYIVAEANRDDMPWDGLVSAQEKLVHGGIECTSDHVTVDIPCLTNAYKTFADPPESDIDFWLNPAERDQTTNRQIAELRQKHAGKLRPQHKSRTPLIIAIAGGSFCVVAAVVALLIVRSRSQTGDEYNTLQEDEELM